MTIRFSYLNTQNSTTRVRIVPSLVAALSLVVLLVAGSSAQTQLELGRLSTAESLTYSGKCEDAVKLLRPLYEQYPNYARVVNSLKNAYVCAKMADSAVALLERQIATAPGVQQRQDLYLEIAGIKLRQGDKEAADQLLAKALQLQSDNLDIFEKIANTYMSGGYYSDAVKFLTSTRETRKNGYLFNRKLAQLYEIMRNYGDAATEYFSMVLLDSTQERYAEGRINHLIELDADEEFDTGLGGALSKIVAGHPADVLAQRLYGTYLVEQGSLEQAYQRFLTVDSLGSRDGKDLLHFAEMARDHGAHDLVERACTRIESLPQSPYVTQSQIILAESHYQEHRYQQAADIYGRIIATSPDSRAVAAGLYALAYTQFEGLHQPDSAIVTLTDLYKRFSNMPVANQGLVVMADCRLAMKQPETADSIYGAIDLKRLPVETQEELAFKKAELQFLLGNFEAAKQGYSAMMNAFPKSVYVNDALRRLMLITEHEGMDQATLQVYSAALLAEKQFDYEIALQKLAGLKTTGTDMLRELAHLEAGQLQQQREQYEAALAEYDALVTSNPESFYTPIALELEGDIYSNQIRDCARAREVYEKVLLEHPKSLNADSVRRKLNRVERFLCTSPEDSKS